MAIPELTEDVKIIQALSTYPNWEDGLTEEQMKQKFDAAAVIIKNYLNGTLVPAVQLLQRALNNGDIIAVDDTLTTEGYAADAKVTGDRLKALEEPEAPLPVEKGGTGANTAAGALANLGAMNNTLVNEEIKIEVAEGPTLDEALKTIFANMVGGTNRLIRVTRSNDFTTENLVRFSLGGGSDWMVLITKASAKYGSIMAWQYQVNRVDTRTRAINNGTWHDWIGNTPKVLWQNPDWGKDRTSSFGPQTINLDPWATRYNCLMVVCRHQYDLNILSYCLIVDTGLLGSLVGCCYFPAAQAKVLVDTSEMSTWRFFTWLTDKTKLKITAGMYQHNKTSYNMADRSDGACIPMRVYGLNV